MPELDKPISEILADMRKLATDPATKAAMQAGWNAVLDRLEPLYLAKRPKMRSFEVHHMNEKAREAFMRAYVAGRDMDACVKRAVASVGVVS